MSDVQDSCASRLVKVSCTSCLSVCQRHHAVWTSDDGRWISRHSAAESTSARCVRVYTTVSSATPPLTLASDDIATGNNGHGSTRSSVAEHVYATTPTTSSLNIRLACMSTELNSLKGGVNCSSGPLTPTDSILQHDYSLFKRTVIVLRLIAWFVISGVSNMRPTKTLSVIMTCLDHEHLPIIAVKWAARIKEYPNSLLKIMLLCIFETQCN